MQRREAAVVLGAGGFVGRELVRLITTHPQLTLAAALSQSQAGESITDVYTELSGLTEGVFQAPSQFDWKSLDGTTWTLFSALGHGETMQVLPGLLGKIDRAAVKVVDLSGDFRLSRGDVYSQYYGMEHAAPEWLECFTYGLPEFHGREIARARLVSNPGCFATAAQLALLPLASFPQQPGFVAIDGKTGSSGAGIQPRPTTHHPLRANNFQAYKPLGHQHLAEILQGWDTRKGSAETVISFVPQMTPMVRGIFVTLHAFFTQPVDGEAIQEHFQGVYSGAPFVRILSSSPAVTDVWGTNRCDLSIHGEGQKVIVCAAIDNLVKGASGQAVQNANLMSGWPETAGLQAPPPRPV